MSFSKQALLAEISQSRAALVRDARALREELNIAEKLRSAVRVHTPLWLGGAAMIGFFSARVFGQAKKIFPSSSKKRRSRFRFLKWSGMLLLGLFRILPWIKPAISAYVQTHNMLQLNKFMGEQMRK